MSQFPGRSGDALLVVDVQNDVMSSLWQPQRIISTIDDLVGRARLAGTPVVWVRHQSPGFEPGSEGWQIVPELTPEAGEAIIEKRYGDSFAETNLDDVLASAGADHIWLTGAQSDFGVRSTLFGGLYRGYDVTLVEDAHTTQDASVDSLHFTGEQLVALVNKLAWTTRLPGLTSQLCKAADVVFAPADRMDDEDKIEAIELEEQAEEDAEDVAMGLGDPEPEA
ncbi:cysteine hydrolase family protein [Luteococcus japonicus]|uniref:Isochorismatase n=1 Tax=Luteococcus japonicus LSP_Lj1 TaxID=1255658 RepID=A0A1R4KDT3_9ACTN|nr:cysteine hydrolase family protein [Luteococcus japonicus]SJN42163.1 Isochorismatase [Luteococcus japonicus LSP_Lj1]